MAGDDARALPLEIAAAGPGDGVSWPGTQSGGSRGSLTSSGKPGDKAPQGGGEAVVGTSSIQTSIFNLVKNIVGSGVLSLSAAMAAGTGIVPAILLTLALAAVSAYTFFLVGRLCDSTGQLNFGGLGVATGGPRFAVTIDTVIAFKTAFTCLGYSVVIGDSFSDILLGFVGKENAQAGFWQAMTNRITVVLVMTALVLVPLCLLKSLDKLKWFSFTGVLGMVYLLFFMLFRGLSGDYGEKGSYYASLDEDFRPKFAEGKNIAGLSFATILLLSTLSTAFIAHYNAPKIFAELQDRSVKNFGVVVMSSFGIAAALFVLIMVVGYLTFGDNVQGNILNNYSTEDAFATLARVGVGFSTVFSYPIAFTGLRGSVTSLLGLPSGDRTFNMVTACLLIPITGTSLVFHDLKVISSLGGAIFGACIIYIFPCVIFIFATHKGFIFSNGLDAKLTMGLVFFGGVLVLLGSYTSIGDLIKSASK